MWMKGILRQRPSGLDKAELELLQTERHGNSYRSKVVNKIFRGA